MSKDDAGFRDEARNTDPYRVNQEVFMVDKVDGIEYKRRVVLSSPERSGRKPLVTTAVELLTPDTSSPLAVIQDSLLWVSATGLYVHFLRLFPWMFPDLYGTFLVLTLALLPLVLLMILGFRLDPTFFFYRVMLVFIGLAFATFGG